MNHTKKSKGTDMKTSNRTLSMMSPKVKRSVMAVSMATALGLNSTLYADTMTQRFEADPGYKTYESLLDSGKNAEALKIKRGMLEKLTAQIFSGYEMSERSRKGLTEKFNSMPLQMKTIWCDLYLKSKNLLSDESQRIQFNAHLALFLDSIQFGYGNSLWHAKTILEDIRFNDDGKFAKELVEVGKNGDLIAQYKKEIAENKKEIAEWNKIIERLKKLGQ